MTFSSTFKKKSLVCVATLWIMLSGCATGRLVIISIDGLRPDFYLSDYDAPTLKKLASLGASAEGAETVYPSVTYTSHTSIVTGVRSAEHGVLSNTVLSPQDGSNSVWYWDTKHLKAPTLWGEAEAAGKNTAILTWPVSLGAKVHWLIPEVFPESPSSKEKTWDLTRKNMKPEFLAELMAHNEEKELEGFEQRDRWVTNASQYVLRKHRPDLTLIHIINVDNLEHATGRDSAETRHALQVADEQLAKILESIDLTSTTVIVLGDHGFYDYDKWINLMTLFAGKAWAKEVVIHPGGSQASIYSLDPKNDQEILAILKKHAAGAYNVLGRAELDRLEAFPGALCAVDPATHSLNASGKPAPGYSIGKGETGSLITPVGRIKGNHGSHPSDPQLRTGLIAVGPGIPAGKKLGQIHLLSVAPTAAKILGISLPQAKSPVLDLW